MCWQLNLLFHGTFQKHLNGNLQQAMNGYEMTSSTNVLENKCLLVHINWCLVLNVHKLNTCWCQADLNMYRCALSLHLRKRLVNCTLCGVQFSDASHCESVPWGLSKCALCARYTKRLVTKHYVMYSCVSTLQSVQLHKVDT